MQLSQEAIRDWIDALKRDPDATAEAQPPQHPLSQFTKVATWRITVFLSAYSYTPTSQDVERVVVGVPESFNQFDTLTEKKMQFFYLPDSPNISSRSSERWPDWAQLFKADKDDVAILHVMDQRSKEASQTYCFDAICAFKRSSQPGGKLQRLSRFTARVPLAFWIKRKQELTRWWLNTLAMLQPEQAYIGLGFGSPPQLERYPFIEPAEFALANAFYGLDVDKPMFMCASPKAETKNYLEHGMRTPTFGVFVSPKYLPALGGELALRQNLSVEPRISVEEVAGGLWLQAGEAPALYPVEQGIPRHVACLAQALKPARLDALWLLSYMPALPRDDCFNYETSRRWLRRFDDDGDWPSKDVRFWRDEDAIQAASARPPSTHAGQPCPREGWWFTPAKIGSRRHFKQGEPMPDFKSDWGSVIWQWDEQR